MSLPPKVNNSIQQFCVAKQKLKKIQSKYNEERRPVSQREHQIKDILVKWMTDNNLTISKINSSTFLILKKSSTVTPLNLDGIERAIMSITPEDLKKSHDTLIAKKKRGKKRNAEGGVITESIKMAEIWECAALEKIRQEHIRENTRLIIKSSKGGGGGGDNSDENSGESDGGEEVEKLKIQNQNTKVAPDQIKNLVGEWQQLKNKITEIRERKSEQSQDYKNVIEKEQSAVCEYLEKNHPVDKSRVVVLQTKEGQLQFNLKKKESYKSTRQVRITTFKPIIRECIDQIYKAHSGRMSNYTVACSNEIKHSIFAVLSTQYVKFQETQKVKKEYAALDKIAVKKQK